MLDAFLDYLLSQPEDPTPIDRLIGGAVVAAIALLGYAVAHFIIFHYVARLVEAKAPAWNRAFRERNVYRLSAYLVPVLIASALAPFLIPSRSDTRTLFSVIAWMMMTILLTWIINNLLNALLDIYEAHEMSKSMPLTGLAQAFKVVLYLLSTFIVIAILLDLPLLYFIAGFVALITAASFVLKDPILGFMAGIQLAGNKMVAIGDRIQMPQYGVDGFVQEISLITVKIRNIDRTISTIPTYTMVSETFQNWDEVIDEGGRRIKDPIFIDVRSIKIVDAQMIARLRAIPELADTLLWVHDRDNYITLQLTDSASYPMTEGNLTNLGLFRTYIIDYLRRHPGINQNRRISAHVLAGTEQGIPLEVWAFARETIVPGYHRIRSELFEHFFSVIPLFELELYQAPTGQDLLAALNAAEEGDDSLTDTLAN